MKCKVVGLSELLVGPTRSPLGGCSCRIPRFFVAFLTIPHKPFHFSASIRRTRSTLDYRMCREQRDCNFLKKMKTFEPHFVGQTPSHLNQNDLAVIWTLFFLPTRKGLRLFKVYDCDSDQGRDPKDAFFWSTFHPF